MAKEVTFSIKGLADLDVSQFTQQLDRAKTALGKLSMPQGVENSFTSLFKKLNDQILDFEQKSKRTFGSMSEIKAAEKSYAKLQQYIEDFNFALSKIDMSKLSMKDAGSVKGLQEGLQILRNFEAQTQETTKEMSKLQSQLSKKLQSKIDVSSLVEAASSGEDLGRQLANLRSQNTRLKVDASDIQAAQSEIDSLTTQLAEARSLRNRLQQTADNKSATADDVKAYTDQISAVQRLEQALKQAKARQEELNSTQEEYKRNVQIIEQIAQAYKELQALSSVDFSQIFGGGSPNIQPIQNLIQALEQLKSVNLDSVKQPVQEAARAMDDLGAQARTAGDGIRACADSGTELTRLNNQVEQLRNNFLDFFSLTNGWYLLQRAIRSAYETVKELDDSMTEIAVVSDYSLDDIWALRGQYSEEATKLGAETIDLVDATKLYVQQGLDLNEAMEVGIETTKMARIANLDGAEATNLMTAALRGFNMEMQQANEVNDVYSELAAITAADTQEIAVAMSKTASIANNAGSSFENMSAFLAQIIETTREAPETAGTAMKTIIARFQELKKPMDEIGEVDGEIVDANKIETALREAGVALRDVNGEFRNFDEVILELASKWDTLDIMTQRYIATQAAGSRQQSRFLALMSDQERLMELVGAANNAQGSANRQYEKTLDSLQSKINELNNALDIFWTNLANNTIIKTAIELLTMLINLINKLVGVFSQSENGVMQFVGSLLQIALLYAAFKGATKLIQSFSASVVGTMGKAGTDASVSFVTNLKNGFSTLRSMKDVRVQLMSALAGKKGKAKDGITLLGLDKVFESFTPAQIKKVIKPNVLKSLRNDIYTQLDFSSLSTELQGKVDQAFDTMATSITSGGEKAKHAMSNFQKDLNNITTTDAEGKTVNAGLGNKPIVASADIQNIMLANTQLIKMQTIFGGVSAAAIGLSGIFSLLAQNAKEAGNEDMAEVWNNVGTALMIVSAAAGILTAIFPILQTVGVTAGLTTTAAWIAFLAPILAIVAAIGLVVAAFAWAANEAHKNSLAGQMEAAAEATERAADAAEKAKTAYDELLSARNEYDEIQNNLAELTRGTEEWKQSLVEANQQVLELLNTYPQLAQYIGRGEDGQLIIFDKGWDKIDEDQLRAANNANTVLMVSQMEETRLRLEQAKRNIQKEYPTNRDNLIAYPSSHGNVHFGTEEYSDSDSEVSILFENDILDQMLEAYQENPDELMRTDIDAEGNTVYSPVLKDIAAQSDQTAAELYETIDALAAYDAALIENEAILQGQAEALLSAQASQETLDYEYREDVISIFAKQMTTEDYSAREEELASEVYKDDKSSEWENNEYFQDLAKEYSVMNKMTGDNTHDLEVLYAAMAGLKDVEDIPEELKGNEEELAKKIGKIQAANEKQEGLEDFRIRMEGINNTTVERQIAGLMSGNAHNFSLAEIEDLGNLSDYAGQLGYESADEMAKALGYTGKLFDLMSREDQIAYAKTQVERTAGMSDQDYELAISAWIESNRGRIISAEEQMNLASEQMKQQMQKIYDDAKAGLDAKGVNQILYENASIGVVENLSKQVSEMGAMDARAYVQEWRDVIDSANLSEMDTRNMEEYLSTVDWSNLEEAVDAMEYLQNEGTDPTAMIEFWNAATDGANAFVASVAEAASLMDKIHEKGVNADELQERFINGEATNEDIAALEKAGVNLEGLLTRTADGWQMTEKAAISATNALRDNIVEQAQSSLDQEKQKIDEFNRKIVGIDYLMKSGSSGIEYFGELAMMMANTDENGNLIAGNFSEANVTVRNQIAGNLGIKRSAYNSDEEYWAAAEEKYLEYINTVNNQEAILDIMQQEVDYQRAAAMSSDRNALEGGSDQSVIWSAQNEVKNAGLDTQEMREYAASLQVLNPELEKYDGMAARIAADNMIMNQSLNDLVDNWEEWETNLQQPGTEGYARAIVQLRANMKGLLGITDDLSEDFLTNARNMRLMEQAARGDMAAIDKLRAAAAKDILINIGLEQDDVNNIYSAINDLINENVEIGASLDTTSFGDALFDILVASGATVDDINSLFTAIGWEPDLDYEEMSLNEAQAYSGTTQQEVLVPDGIDANGVPQYKTMTIEAAQNAEIGGNATVRVPVIKGSDGSTKPSSVKASILANTRFKGGGNQAISSSNTNKAKDSGDPWEADYDWLYNLVNKTEAETRTLTKLQWEYERALRASGTSARELLENLEKQEESLKRQQQYYQQQQSGRYEELRRVQAEYSDVGQYAWYNESTGYVEIDWDAIDALSGQTGNNEIGERIDEYIARLEEIQDQIDETEDALMDIEDEIAELDEQGWDEYVDLEQRIFDAIVQLRQDEIDKLTELNESINEANTKMLEKIQTGIDDYRNARQLEEDAENIQDMEGRLALMQSDTSGANALDILALQEELQDARQSYTDSLIDKSIEEMTRQNEQAYEQRQMQIDLMIAQLEWDRESGAIAQQTNELMTDYLKNGPTNMINLLKDTDLFNGMAAAERKDWVETIEDAYAQGMASWVRNHYVKDTGKQITFTDSNGVKRTGTIVGKGQVKVGNTTYSGVYQTPDGGFTQELEGGSTTKTPTQPSTPPASINNNGATIPSKGWGVTVKKGAKFKNGKIFDEAIRTSGFDPKHKGGFYVYQKSGDYYLLGNGGANKDPNWTGWVHKQYLTPYATGGLADFTGPAWLDGSKAHPELVLSARDTENFIQLKNILADGLDGKGASGDNYYDVHIEVDQLSNDYDVEQMMDKMKRLIEEDAAYRNVNAVDLGRR